MSTHVLDHIIHLSPPGSIERISSQFRELGFDVIQGGAHTGGLTYNALVTLSDGVYLELIAFLKEPSPSHRWGTAPPGWIDFVNLGLTSDIARVINDRAAKDGSGLTYSKGELGGRVTPEGKALKWRVTAPEITKHGIGRLPFFCEDITPRKMRVPKPGNHASSARGIAYIKLLATSKAEFTTLFAQLTTALGSPPLSTNSETATWALDTPTQLPGLHTRLILEEGSSTGNLTSGIHEVGFWVDKGRGGEADSPYGKIVWTPVP